MTEPSNWIFAAFEGECADCTADIEPGDPIAYDESIGGYICERCGMP